VKWCRSKLRASVRRRALDGKARQLQAISGNRRMSETVVVFELRRFII
jgi:hypothetical protein